MSAETLRKAADLLDELAGKATPGPWETYEMPERGENQWTGTGIGVVGDEMGHRAEAMFTDDAAYIARMSPEVGMALAAWLREAAEAFDNHMARQMDPLRRFNSLWLTEAERKHEHALAVARAILREGGDQ